MSPKYRYAREFDTVYPEQRDKDEHSLVATLGTVHEWPKPPDDRWVLIEPAAVAAKPAPSHNPA